MHFWETEKNTDLENQRQILCRQIIWILSSSQPPALKLETNPHFKICRRISSSVYYSTNIHDSHIWQAGEISNTDLQWISLFFTFNTINHFFQYLTLTHPTNQYPPPPFASNRAQISLHLIHQQPQCHNNCQFHATNDSSEMEKRADTADISVLFFLWLCLFFSLCSCKLTKTLCYIIA